MNRKGRKKGSKNKPKSIIPIDLNQKARHYADLFICCEHIDGAEKLTVRILELIRANKKRLDVKYGN